ncbi:UbiA family prenyltransferase [archaeon]|nr:UbiA family prenyltransferase [archaeon]
MVGFGALWSLTRAEHALGLFIGVIIGAVVSAPSLDSIPKLALLFAALSSSLQWLGITSANDFWDYETDRANRRTDRPLVTGIVSHATVATTAFVTVLLSMVLALVASHLSGNYLILLVASIYATLGVLYSYRVKNWPLAGNAVVALGMALPYPFGSLVLSQLSAASLLIAGAAFCFGMGRELIKSVMDAEGDLKTGRRTFPIMFGTKAASILAAVFLCVSIILIVVPFFSLPAYAGDFLFLSIATIASIVTIKVIVDTILLHNYRQSRQLTLAASFLALLAFLVGALV